MSKKLEVHETPINHLQPYKQSTSSGSVILPNSSRILCY